MRAIVWASLGAAAGGVVVALLAVDRVLRDLDRWDC